MGLFSPRHESSCATVSGSSRAMPPDHAADHAACRQRSQLEEHAAELRTGGLHSRPSRLPLTARAAGQPGQFCQRGGSSPGLPLPLNPCFSL